MAQSGHTNKSYLTLGWKVTAGGDPEYWLTPNPKPGAQPDDALVSVPAEAMGTHTAIIAQSGSGKSFFLGRLIEELLLNTRGRCVVLDSNSDFAKVHLPKDAQLWLKARYDLSLRRGSLPHEASQEEFAKKWAAVRVRIRTRNTSWLPSRFLKSGVRTSSPYEKLELWWPTISVDFLSEDLNYADRIALYHCHRWVQDMSDLVTGLGVARRKSLDVASVAEELLDIARTPAASATLNDVVTTHLGIGTLEGDALLKAAAAIAGDADDYKTWQAEVAHGFLDYEVQEVASGLMDVLKYVPDT